MGFKNQINIETQKIIDVYQKIAHSRVRQPVVTTGNNEDSEAAKHAERTNNK